MAWLDRAKVYFDVPESNPFWRAAENFLFVGQKSYKMVRILPHRAEAEIALDHPALSYMKTAIKVVCYITLILPFIALIVREIARAQYTFAPHRNLISRLPDDAIDSIASLLPLPQVVEFYMQQKMIGWKEAVKEATKGQEHFSYNILDSDGIDALCRMLSEKRLKADWNAVASAIDYENVRSLSWTFSPATEETLQHTLQSARALESLSLSVWSRPPNHPALQIDPLDTLTKLDFAGSKALPSLFHNLSRVCPNLRELKLGFSQEITPQLFEEIARLHHLQKLVLPLLAFKITTTQLVTLLRGCPKLRELHIFNASGITAENVGALPEPLALQFLSLNYTQGTAIVPLLRTFSSLQYLALGNSMCSEAELDAFPVSDSLKGLEISKFLNRTPYYSAAFLEKYPNLEILDLLNCRFSVEAGLFHTLPRLSKLTSLKLPISAPGITGDELIQIFQTCTQLQKLQFFSIGLTLNREALGVNNQLQELVINDWLRVPETFEVLCDAFPSLTLLDLNQTPILSERNAESLSRLPLLRQLYIHAQTPDDVYQMLQEKLPGVEISNIYSCPNWMPAVALDVQEE